MTTRPVECIAWKQYAKGVSDGNMREASQKPATLPQMSCMVGLCSEPTHYHELHDYAQRRIARKVPVNTPTAHYSSMIKKWTRCRAAYGGSDDVKAGGTRFLPPLDSHEGTPVEYDDYLQRAMFYNATGRTVDGLVGAIFNREPEFDAKAIESLGHLEDVTMSGDSASAFASKLAREVFITGRYGTLMEMTEAGEGADGTSGPPRPYWVGYQAEDIISTRTKRIDGGDVLCRVVLREYVEEPKEDDPFMFDEVEQYRVLYLHADEGEHDSSGAEFYRQDTYRQADSGEWVLQGQTRTPMRRGEKMSFIPMGIVGPTGIDDCPKRPPLIDLVDVNLSHYRTMADLEHGRHYTALPTPWVSGLSSDDTTPLRIGSSEAWILEPGGRADMLEFTGQGLGALQTAEMDKRQMMATLGARLLESQDSRGVETATAVAMRHAGDHATLRSVATSIELAITQMLRWHTWWVGTDKMPSEADASAELNKDFFTQQMTPQALQAWVFAWQSGAASFETMFRAMQRGDAYAPGWTPEEEKHRINSDETAVIEN